MTWTLEGRGDWAQWIDRTAVNGWVARCGDLLAALPPQESTLAAYAAQSRWTVDAYRAVSGVAQSINMPLPSFRPYAQAQRERDTGVDLATGIWRRDTSIIVHSPGVYGQVPNVQGYLDLWYRVVMSLDGTVTDQTGDDSPPDRLLDDVDGWGHNCTGDHATGWSCMSWKFDESAYRTDRTDVASIVPLRWHYELALSALRMIVGYATLGDLVEDSRAYIIAQNLATLRALQQDNPAALDEGDIVSAAADVEATRWRGDPGTDTIARVGDAAANAAPSGVGAGVKAAIKGVTLIPTLLLEIFGHAAQHPRDLWGRTLPVVETACLTGQLDPPQPPVHTPPTPPASTTPTLTLYLPPVSVVEIGQGSATQNDQSLDEAARSGAMSGVFKGLVALLAIGVLTKRSRRR